MLLFRVDPSELKKMRYSSRHLSMLVKTSCPVYTSHVTLEPELVSLTISNPSSTSNLSMKTVHPRVSNTFTLLMKFTSLSPKVPSTLRRFLRDGLSRISLELMRELELRIFRVVERL